MRVLIDTFLANTALLRLAGAKPGTYLHSDERTSIAEEIPVFAGNPNAVKTQWYDVGFNHRVERGHAVRELAHHGWFIEVESLDDLYDLMHASGSRLSVQKSPERLLKLETDE